MAHLKLDHRGFLAVKREPAFLRNLCNRFQEESSPASLAEGTYSSPLTNACGFISNPCWFWFLESLFTSSCHTLQTPNSSILVLLTSSSTSNSQTCPVSEASLPPDTRSFSNDKVLPPPSHHLYYSLLLFPLLLQTALVMASILFSLLWNSSKCLWAFSPS